MVLDFTKVVGNMKIYKKEQTFVGVFFNMSLDFIFIIEFFFTYMTMTINLYDNPCGKDILDIVYSGTVTDSANGSSHNNAADPTLFI